MNRMLCLIVVALSVTGCLSVEGAREGGAQRVCQFYARCGEVQPGETYDTFNDCMVDQRASFTRSWPTDRCQGRIDGQNLDVCYRAIENTQCGNVFDIIATLSKCEASDVCTAGSPSGSCNCGQGQTCCNGACVNTSSDSNNCGTCGTICGSGSSCSSGACR